MAPTPPTIRYLLAALARSFEARSVDSPMLSAQLLAAEVLGLERAALLADLNRVLTPGETEAIQALAARREQGEPVAYILGRKEFYGLEFEVTPATLIPRPETEHIVEAALEHFSSQDPILFADLGTGSGALAVTLAVLFPKSRGTALDISPQALAVARKNAERHKVADRLAFLRADFLRPCLPDTSLDLIVANPPYVSRAEYAALSREVRDHEPETALVPGETGLEHIRALAPRARTRLKPGGLLLMEFGCSQGPDVLRLFTTSNLWSQADILKDLAGLDRLIRAVA